MPRQISTRLARYGARPNVLVWQPEPPGKGDASAARRMVSGVWLLDGRLVELSQNSPWDAAAPDHAWQSALHGQGWLDDAAAAADPQVWRIFAGHVWEWLHRYGDGSGPGWAPDLVARRLIRWIAFSTYLLQGRDRDDSEAFFKALGVQARFLSWRWRDTPERIERIEALTGLVYAHLSLQGEGRRTAAAIADLGAQAERLVGAGGAIGSRNPEELARIVALLGWCSTILESAGLKPATTHLVAIRRASAMLRGLTFPAMSLPRFHGGRSGAGIGIEQLLDSGSQGAPAHEGNPMGFVRMAAGETTLMLDGAQAPHGLHALTGHSSALAFEMHAGTQPMIVNCGSGAGFGPTVAIAARRAEAHSTIELGGRGAGQLTEPPDRNAPALLSLRGAVTARQDRDASGTWVLAESMHYEMRLGLRVERRLHLGPKGTRLIGEDTALAVNADMRRKIAELYPPGGEPCPMRVRFHVHPAVRVAKALGGRGIALTLPDGALWVLKSDTAQLAIEPSRYFDETRPQPRATSQIVAATHILDYWGRISWSIEKLPDRSRV